MARVQRQVLLLVSTLKARHDEAEGAARERRELEQAALSVVARERSAGARLCVLARSCVCVCVCARARALAGVCVCVCVCVFAPPLFTLLPILAHLRPSSIPPLTSSVR